MVVATTWGTTEKIPNLLMYLILEMWRYNRKDNIIHCFGAPYYSTLLAERNNGLVLKSENNKSGLVFLSYIVAIITNTKGPNKGLPNIYGLN